MVKVNVRDVNDNRPVFYPATYSVNLAPSSSPGTEVAVVMATDADAGRLGAVTYAISAGNTAGYFGIGETSGEPAASCTVVPFTNTTELVPEAEQIFIENSSVCCRVAMTAV